MQNAYYARPLSLYRTPQEDRDKETIRLIGYEPIKINKPELQAAAKKHGMEVFQELVQETKALFFRGFIDGSIGAGIAKEIAWAREAGLPIIELPSNIGRRTLSVEDTRALLHELGQR